MRRALQAGLLCLSMVLGGLAAATPALPAREDAPEVETEAAHLVNFLRYTQWPQSRFERADSPFLVTVVGSEAIAARVRGVAAASGLIEGRAIEVRWLPDARGSRAAPFDSARDLPARELLRGSHLVFFHSSSGPVHQQVLADLSKWPVLTVSDDEGFSRAGGMFEFERRDRRVVFTANPGAIRNAGLQVSAKVLKLARAGTRGLP